MARSSWSAIYTDIEQRFMRGRRYKLLFLLKALTHHADAFGLCYPGNDRLQELSGIGSTLQLNEALQFLVDGEYIKMWETWNPRRRSWDKDYQISPAVMYIRDELMPYCETLWHTGQRDFSLENQIVMKLNGQPDSESESESESVTRIITHHHHPTNNASIEDGVAVPSDDYKTPERRTKNRRKPKSGKAKSTEKESTHAGGRAPVPDRLDLRKYQSPLPQDEDFAQDLHLMIRMRISQARGLVATYGPAAVAIAAQATKEAMDKGQSSNPPGLLTHLLKKGGISTEDKTLYKSPEEKLREANEQLNHDDDASTD